MHPLIGLSLSGATLTPFDDHPAGTGVLGRPVWGPAQLLRDLELRLGLERQPAPDALRTMRWAARMDTLAASTDLTPQARPFYARSFEVDRLGTAEAVLGMRDALVEAGWDRVAIPDGGPRLHAIAELEARTEADLPLGVSDRIAAVARALEAHGRASDEPLTLYESVTLAESRECWPAVWQRTFQNLERAGTQLVRLEAALPGAPPESDLGKVQAALRATSSNGKAELRRDGTLVVLAAETTVEAGRAAAAMLGAETPEDVVVIRDGDAASLDHALLVHGVPTQGLHSASPWRAALQVLPLALELAFEPKDPYRVFELLSLPKGPFTGASARRLARALSRSPGVGGRAWEEAKERLAEPRAELLGRIAEWFEQPGADPLVGALVADLLKVTARVRAWLASRVATDPEDSTLYAALLQCDAFTEALENERRATLDLVAVRRLAEFVVSVGAALELVPETASRIAHVSSPLGLWAARPTVMWWSFCHAQERLFGPGWRGHELVALAKAGVSFPAPSLLLTEQAKGWRRAIQAATEHLILVVPTSRAGQRLAPHPVWDEVVARLGLDEASQLSITTSCEDLLRDGAEGPPIGALALLELPVGRAEWTVNFTTPLEVAAHSPSSLSTLLGCPLRWVLEQLAGLESERSSIPPMYLLSGMLGHRLIEELHGRGAFRLSEAELEVEAARELDGLFEREGAVLHRPGQGNERAQLRRQLIDAACGLVRVLRQDGFSVVAVEQPFEVPWQGARLRGRTDLLARNDAGRRVVIDMKWGQADYRKALENGEALQLAAYTHAVSNPGDGVDAAFFSLKGNKVLGLSTLGLAAAQVIAGPGLLETWRRVERTLPVLQDQITLGRLAVTGVRASKPLLEALDIPENEHPNHFTQNVERTCKVCTFDALCGRRWEQSA
jgi:RecB family exonuclease